MIQSRVNRTSHRPTGLSVRHYGRRVFIGCLCPGLVEKTCVRNVSRGAVHRSWQRRTALLGWCTLSFCFRSARSLPLTLFSLRTKRCSRSLHRKSPEQSVADCRNFWRRSIVFSPVRALHWLPNRDMENLQSVWGKIRYSKHWKYQNLWMNNKVGQTNKQRLY